MKTLILTEKPSVARDIAKILGNFKKEDQYLSSPEYIITWAFGHLLELAEPEDYDKSYKFWSLQKLPILPDKFQWKPITKSEKQLKSIVSLMKSKEVKTIINACDAGREGELIFRNIFEHSKSKKAHQRLWLSSMTAEAIQSAFGLIKPGKDFDHLAHAAKCRSEADWMVGINATRAVTRRMGELFSLGRVQTPTLAILVEREFEIRAFVVRYFYELTATFQCLKTTYDGRWIQKKTKNQSQKFEIPDKNTAESILQAIDGKEGSIFDAKTRQVKEQHPLLFDLTDLQREANKRFGFTASTTLSIAQTLYEEKKLLTYPRTDSRYLPSDMVNELPEILEALGHAREFESLSKEALASKLVPGKRVIDNSKVSDHFAIIPTKEIPQISKLKPAELNVYDMVVRRFLSIFFEPALYQECTVITEVAEEHFESKEKVLLKPGYRVVFGDSPKPPALADLEKNQAVRVVSSSTEEKETRPRPRYSEATLLSAMQTAGKMVEEEEIKEVIKEKGIGTPATRAQIIERLINVQYCIREGKELVPTEKGLFLIQLLKNIPLPELSSPELTGLWEKKLIEIEKDQLTPEIFRKEMIGFTENMIEKLKKADLDAMDGMEVGLCPKCQSPVKDKGRSFQCTESCGFRLSKRILSGELSIEMVKELLVQGKTSEPSWFKSNQGKKFQAYLKLEENELKFEFLDYSRIVNDESCGSCPKCGQEVLEKISAFQCGNASCSFKISKKILGRSIQRKEIEELLKNKKTSKKLSGFWSKKKKPFSAFLILKDDGSLGFDFGK